jgi:hypothetical protein
MGEYLRLENRECGRRDLLRGPRDTLYPEKLALTSPTSCDISVAIVLSRTKATEHVFCLFEGRILEELTDIQLMQ